MMTMTRKCDGCGKAVENKLCGGCTPDAFKGWLSVAPAMPSMVIGGGQIDFCSGACAQKHIVAVAAKFEAERADGERADLERGGGGYGVGQIVEPKGRVS